LRKTQISNPRRGPFHHRSPANIFLRKVRGMLPYKTRRGMEALERIQVYEGVPALSQKKKRAVVPDAMRVVVLKPDSPYTRLGDLAQKFGWKYASVVAEQEAQRKKEGVAYYKKALAKKNLWKKAEQKAAASNDYKNVVSELAKYGY
jgi:large subunit ribosomal protein L13Ae